MCDTGGTFKSDTPGTFVSDTSGTFGVIYSDTLRLRYEYFVFNISQTQGIHMLTLRLRYGKRILVRSVRISLL